MNDFDAIHSVLESAKVDNFCAKMEKMCEKKLEKCRERERFFGYKRLV